jgi:uncharacterized membrane protein YhhN
MGLELAGLTIIPSFHMVSKAMIMAGIIGFYIFVEKRQNNVFLTGLIFALLGDCFLLFGTVEFFIIGLVCFLIMQLCYAVAFNHKRRIPKNKDYLICLVIGSLGVATIAALWPDLGSMRTPVSLYATSIILMAIYAYLRHPRLRGYKIVIAGVVLFIISDALLGISKFNGALPYGQILVMVTYMLAQYFIVTGEVLSNLPTPKLQPIIDPNSSFSRHKRT